MHTSHSQSHSPLRNQAAIFSTTAASYPHHTSAPPAKRQRKMSITETYRLVHSARGKLTKEAHRSEHDLRLLVGHANLLDSLMLKLEEGDEEQTPWYQSNYQTAATDNKTWATTTTVEEQDLDLPDASDEEDSDSEDDSVYHNDPKMITVRSQPKVTFLTTPMPIISEDMVDDDSDADSDATEEDDDEDEEMMDDEDEHNLSLALCRTRSHSPVHALYNQHQQLPELVSDSDDSDDESMPPSPPTTTLDYSGIESNFNLINTKQAAQHVVEALYEDGFYIPNSEHHHHHHQSTRIAAH